MNLRQTHSYNNFVATYHYRGKQYLIHIHADIAVRGLLRGAGTTTSVWRISNNPAENNENGVIPGVKGWQGPFSESMLKKKLSKFQWGRS